MVRLPAEDRRRYHEEGLLFPVPVLSADEVRRFRDACDDLEARLGGKPRTVDVRQMHLHFRWAYELATHPHILDAVEDLLGPDLLVWATELFAKHPHDRGVSVGWHRDRPYMAFPPATAVTAWVALADSTPANGCMRALPRPAEAAPGAAVDVVLRAGEMSLHDTDVLHGSGPNPSGEKRVGFVVRYVRPDARPLRGRPPAVRARGHADSPHFRLVGAPPETPPDEALAALRDSAAEHLEAILHNLRHATT
jgi:non-haem Fe2+, alpha-ketoglutarate-dependent halogenase